MKETDYSVIQNEILMNLTEQDWTIEDYLIDSTIVLAISNIYTMADLVSAFAQDFKYDINVNEPGKFKKLTIISNNEKISILSEDGMSYYKADVPICGYENLTEDIAYIFVIIQTVFDRILSRA